MCQSVIHANNKYFHKQEYQSMYVRCIIPEQIRIIIKDKVLLHPPAICCASFSVNLATNPLKLLL